MARRLLFESYTTPFPVFGAQARGFPYDVAKCGHAVRPDECACDFFEDCLSGYCDPGPPQVRTAEATRKSMY